MDMESYILYKKKYCIKNKNKWQNDRHLFEKSDLGQWRSDHSNFQKVSKPLQKGSWPLKKWLQPQ